MKLALVTDSPREGRDPGLEYAHGVIRAVEEMTDVAGTYKDFFCVDTPQPKAGVPPLALVRAQQARLFEEVNAWAPDAILTMGSVALKDMAGTGSPALKDERGRMRWWGNGLIRWVPTVAPFHVTKYPDLHRDFADDVYKVMTQGAPFSPIDIELHVPKTLDDLGEALALLEGASVVGVDVETTGLNPRSDTVDAVGVGAVSEDGEFGVAVVVTRELLEYSEARDLLWDAVWRISRRTVGHNFKFDMQFLEKVIGWAPPNAWLGDTMLLGHLLDERPTRMNSRARGHGLKDAVAVRYDLKYGFDFDEPLFGREDELHVYLGQDVCYTARYWHDLKREADAQSGMLMTCHDMLLMPVSKALAKCEDVGAPVDLAWVKETTDGIDARIVKARGIVEKHLPLFAKTMVIDNVLSPTQMGDLYFGEWGWTPKPDKYGNVDESDRSVDKDHMKVVYEKYKFTQPRRVRYAKLVEHVRQDMKTRAMYTNLVNRVEGDRVHASFLMHGTSTGRLSSRDPNLQNVPAVHRVGSEQVRPMRRAFKPANGWKWIEVDYSQLELRVAAALSGDQAFAEVYRSGRDVHREIASSIFSKPPEDITDSERFLAKAVSFGIIYGRSGMALAGGGEMDYAETLGMKRWSVEQAQAFIDKFLRSYPQLRSWIDKQHKRVFIDKYVETPFGRRRRFTMVSRGSRGSIERQAVNTPVQSTASDICLSALVKIAQRIETEQLRAVVLFPVHDSICIECAPEHLSALEKVCRDVMEVDFMGVPLKVDFEVGDDWASTEKKPVSA